MSKNGWVPSDRPLLTASVNEETLERFRAFSAHCGCSISALIEAVGRMLPDDDEPGREWHRQMTRMARSIDADRRRRTRPTEPKPEE